MRRPGVALSAAVGVLVLLAPAALGGNEFAAYIQNAVGPVYDGLRGNMNIRTDPATDPDVTYAHITQMDLGSPEGTFIAIGTYNGAAVPHPNSNCTASLNPLWSGYYDGEIGGAYFCEKFASNQFGIGSNPTFQMLWDPVVCGGQWVLTFNGITRACLATAASSSDWLVVGLETRSLPDDPTDRNIDVKYTNLKRNQTNGTQWLDLGTPILQKIDPNYTGSHPSTTAYNLYLAPLD